MAYLVKATDEKNKVNAATHSGAQTGERTVDLYAEVKTFCRSCRTGAFGVFVYLDRLTLDQKLDNNSLIHT